MLDNIALFFHCLHTLALDYSILSEYMSGSNTLNANAIECIAILEQWHLGSYYKRRMTVL